MCLPRMATACFLPPFFLFLNDLIVILFALKERLYTFSWNWLTFYDCLTTLEYKEVAQVMWPLNLVIRGHITFTFSTRISVLRALSPHVNWMTPLRPSCCEEAQTITCIEATCTPGKIKRCLDSSQMLCFSSSHQLTKTTQEILNQNGPAKPFTNFWLKEIMKC